MFHGFGLEIYHNIYKYEGFHYMGRHHAYGILSFLDGENYDGEFLHGKKQGHGICTWNTGEKYEGQFKNNMIHGIGIFHQLGKKQRKSEWREDEHIRFIDSSNNLD